MKSGDVLYSEEKECNVTVNTVFVSGVLCDWFERDGNKWGAFHRETLKPEKLAAKR